MYLNYDFGLAFIIVTFLVNNNTTNYEMPQLTGIIESLFYTVDSFMYSRVHTVEAAGIWRT